MNKLYALLLCIVLFGCSPKVDKRIEHLQTCEMCGSEWLVSSADQNVPSTVEWCFNDGQYCREGLDIITKSLEDGVDDKIWINHCLKCRGCRYASFNPDQWHKLMDSLEVK